MAKREEEMSKYWDHVSSVVVDLATRYGVRAIGAVAIALLTVVLAIWAGHVVHKLAARSGRISATVQAPLAKLSRGVVALIGIAAVLDTLGVPTHSLIAMIGAMGLSVGLALKDTVADLAAGIALLVLRPFEVGDLIDIDGTMGTVIAVHMIQTELCSLDGVPLSLPNHKVRTARIQNFTRADRRRVQLSLHLGYHAEIGEAIANIERVAGGHERLLAQPAPAVTVKDMGDRSVVLELRAWTKPADLLAVKLELSRQLTEQLVRAGIPMPADPCQLHHG